MARLLVGVFLCVSLWSAASASWTPDLYRKALLRTSPKQLSPNLTWWSNRELWNRDRSAPTQPKQVFPCEIPQRGSSQTPTSVHRLRPSDVNVVAAMGDSITAGNGIRASTSVGVLRQLRGESWSVGGDLSLEDGITTLPNILKMYNPNLKGFSTGYGGPTSENAWLNVAIPGGKSENLPAEADDLIEKMKTDPRIDWNNDWKVITLLIGGNNLCDYCFDREKYSPEMVGNDIRTALDKLHAVVPRVLVNLVPMGDVVPIPTIKTGLFCDALHWSLCQCATDSATKGELKGIQMEYYAQLQTLASNGRYDTREDFTVVLQPFMVNQDFPRDPDTGKYDKTFIAPDCFHPNYKTHQGLAKLLWNTMITPLGEKRMSLPNDELIKFEFKCPTAEAPYIFTNQNSA